MKLVQAFILIQTMISLILDDLNIGEAVLKGHFIVGQNQRVLTNPIKCSISLERGIENANLCASTL